MTQQQEAAESYINLWAVTVHCCVSVKRCVFDPFGSKISSSQIFRLWSRSILSHLWGLCTVFSWSENPWADLSILILTAFNLIFFSSHKWFDHSCTSGKDLESFSWFQIRFCLRKPGRIWAALVLQKYNLRTVWIFYFILLFFSFHVTRHLTSKILTRYIKNDD